METVSLPLTAHILLAPSGGSIVPCMPERSMEAKLDIKTIEIITPIKFFMMDFFKMNNGQTANVSDQNHKNNYHAIGCLKSEGICIDLGILLAWSLFLFY